MLDYVKLILQKVSFDASLFEKELRKSIANYLKPEEVNRLKAWCYEKFTQSDWIPILDKCFV